MGNVRKKALKRLNARINKYDEMAKKYGAKWTGANKKPGSLKLK